MAHQANSDFFILKDGKVVTINPKVLLIPEFVRLWNRDKSKNNKKALKEFAFVYFMADYNSEYNAYGLDMEEQITEDIFGDRKYKVDDMVQEAVGKYEFFQNTHSMRMLKSLRKRADRYIRHNETEALAEKFDPKKTIQDMKNFEEIMEQLEKWEKKVAGESDEMIIRGGGKVGLFEDAESATYLK